MPKASVRRSSRGVDGRDEQALAQPELLLAQLEHRLALGKHFHNLLPTAVHNALARNVKILLNSPVQR